MLTSPWEPRAEPGGFTPHEQERYDGNRRYFHWLDHGRRADPWEPQRRLRAARVTILGLGGTGATAALTLAAAGAGRLHLVDGTDIELAGLNRQTQYAERDLGRPKAEVAAARLRRLNSGIVVTAERATVARDGLDRLIATCDAFVLCAGGGDIRPYANRSALRHYTPWVDAVATGPAVHATAYVPGSGPCHACYPPQPPAGPAGAATAVTAGLAGTLAAHLTIALLTGLPRVEPGRRVGLDLAWSETRTTPAPPRHPQCPACGNRR